MGQSQSRQLESIAVELHQAQAQLLRQQVATLAGALGILRQEFATFRSSQEDAHAGLNAAVDSKMKELDDRLGSVGDLCGRQAQTHEVMKVQIEQMHNRLSACEKQSVDMASLHSSLDALAQHTASIDAKHSALTERVGHLANNINFVADRHDKQVEALNAHKAAHSQVC